MLLHAVTPESRGCGKVGHCGVAAAGLKTEHKGTGRAVSAALNGTNSEDQ
jgi:hypothetical protein